jgi:hypothetical protein
MDAVLIGEHACERERREVAVADDDLAEEASCLRLLGESLLELVFGEQLLGDKKLAELTPGKLKCRILHTVPIGSSGSKVQSFSTADNRQSLAQDL